jgi:hypothetical protein
VTEGDVGAGGDVAHAQTLAQHRAGEVLVGLGGEFGVEGQAIEPVHAQVGDGPGLLVRVGDPEGLGLRIEEAAGMGFEGHHAQGRAEPTRRRRSAGDHRPMAAMHPVEGAQGDRGALGVGAQVAPVMDHPHARAHAASASPRRGTRTLASPASMDLRPTEQWVDKVAVPVLRSIASTRTRISTSSPIRTARLKFSVWD